MRPQQEPSWVDVVISRLLRVGVTASVAIVAAGLIFTFVHHPEYVSSRPALGELVSPREYIATVSDVLHGVEARRGQAIVMLGVLLLIATPVLRVAVSILIFIIERDWMYVAMTAVVLALLAASFFIGATG